MIRKTLSLLLTGILLLAVILAGCDQAPSSGGQANDSTSSDIGDIAIGTAAAGGAWYPIGAAMSDIISQSGMGIAATVQTTGGGIENCKLVSTGDCEIAITIGYLAYNAQNAADPYPEVLPNISAMFGGLSVGVMQLVVPGDSDIYTFADLKGKKVSVGPAGGGAITALTACLEQYGVSYSEITPSYVTYDEGVTMMTDGNVDAAIVYGGVPTPAVKTLEAGGKNFRLLTLTQEEQAAILGTYTYFSPVTIPTEMYGLDNEVLTVGTPNIVICNTNLPEDVVYEMCSLFFSDENLQRIRDSQPSAQDLSLENATEVPIPLHPGAERYFKEIGVL